ncbi:hypothetical protein ACWD7C_30100 [Streptomyces sp. NPDC005134]|uniref:hypothetical protein n=1 Tax=Streptomyces sp. NPDC005098 TaxID=3154560 RepID=UPI0033A64D9B
MAHATITVLGSEIIPGDVLKRLPGVPVASAADVDPQFPHSRTLRMADGSWYFCDPQQMYVVARELPDETPASRVLVVGPCQTPAEVADLTAYAFDVTDQLGYASVVATSTDHLVTNFAGVVVYGPSLTEGATGRIDLVSCVLEAEAIAHKLPVITPQSARDAASCDACGQFQTIATVRDAHGEVFCVDCTGDALGCAHCLEDEPTEPVYVDGGWAPQCEGCARITKSLKPSEWNIFDEAAHVVAAPLLAVEA